MGVDPLMDARLDMKNFEDMLNEPRPAGDGERLTEEYVEKSFKMIDADGSGAIDPEEFAVWYKTNYFGQELSVNETERAAREICTRLEIDPITYEKYWDAFKKYDVDGSGAIDEDEFKSLVAVLLKVPEDTPLPPERAKAF